MNALITIFSLLSTLALIMLAASAFTPRTAWFFKVKSKGKGALMWLGVLLLSFFVVGILAPPPPETTQVKAPAAMVEELATEQKINTFDPQIAHIEQEKQRLESAFDIEKQERPAPAALKAAPLKTVAASISEFVANYNQFSGALKTEPLKLSEVKRLDGPQASASTFISTYTSIVIQSPLNSDQATGAMFIGTGDGSELSGVMITLSATNFVAALTPALDADRRGAAAKQLGLPTNTVDGKARQWQNEKIKITSQFSEITGLMLTASPVE